MSPEELFRWKESLEGARSALQAGDAAAGAKVHLALTDATRMAELCHNRLFRMPPGQIPTLTLKEWKAFLEALYKHARIYLKHFELISPRNEGDIQLTLVAVRNAARDASYGLKYMDSGPSEAEGREAAVEKLDDLVVVLEEASVKLQPLSGIATVGETSMGADTEEVVWVPRVGRISAGLPNLAQQAVEGYYPLPRRLVGRGEHYLVEVSGDSMIDAGISQGDLLVVRVQPHAENGEIVVAMAEGEEAVEGDTSVKEFRVEDGHAWLVPHNEAYTRTLADQATIFGKVVTVLHVI